MCYAIPGKVMQIDGQNVILDYFGEKRRGRNEFYALKVGDYVLAQGGFIVDRIDPAAAQATLETWQELFFKLKKIDLNLSQDGNTLHQTANRMRQKNLGNACCVHGIIEFSNYCRNDCRYCGIRKSRKKLKRYRMTVPEIIKTADHAVNTLGFRALVLQSGEDPYYSGEKLVELVKKIRERCGVLLFMSIGERDFSIYEKLYRTGARGVLLRFETSNPALYERFRPKHKLETRIQLLKALSELGYLIITGALIGLPGQTDADILDDIRLTRELKAEMYSFGPVLGYASPPSLEKVLEVIARARIMDPKAKIVATTALQTLDKENGARAGLLAGANSLMINVTPRSYRDLYEIYPDRFGMHQEVSEEIGETVKLLKSLGRAPSDLPAGRQA